MIICKMKLNNKRHLLLTLVNIYVIVALCLVQVFNFDYIFPQSFTSSIYRQPKHLICLVTIISNVISRAQSAKKKPITDQINVIHKNFEKRRKPLNTAVSTDCSK